MSPDYKEPGAAARDGPLSIATRPGAAIVRRARPRRVSPFRLARQAIALARPGAQPLRIRPGIRVNIDNLLDEKTLPFGFTGSTFLRPLNPRTILGTVTIEF